MSRIGALGFKLRDWKSNKKRGLHSMQPINAEYLLIEQSCQKN